MVDEQTSWVFSVSFCLQAKPRYQVAVSKHTRDRHRCTRTHSGEPEKTGQEARNQSPASSRHSGGEGPLPPPVLAASFLTKPPPTPTSWGPGSHLESSPNCHTCLVSKNHPCNWGRKTLLADVTGALRGALLRLARSAGREKGSPDNQMHLQFLFCVGYKATFFFFSFPCARFTSKSKEK